MPYFDILQIFDKKKLSLPKFKIIYSKIYLIQVSKFFQPAVSWNICSAVAPPWKKKHNKVRTERKY